MSASRAERVYRAALRSYPAGWRAAHAECALSALLDATEAAGVKRALPREVLSLVSHGVRERKRVLLPERAIGAAATWALASAAAFGVFSLWFVELEPAGAHQGVIAGSFGPFRTPGAVSDLLMIALVLLAYARVRVLLNVGLAVSVATTLAIALVHPQHSWAGPTLPTLVFQATLAGLAAVGGRIERRRLSVALVSAVAGAMTVLLVNGAPPPAALYWFWDVPAQPTNLTLAIGICILVAALLQLAGDAARAGALLLYATPWVVMWVFGLWMARNQLARVFVVEQVMLLLGLALVWWAAAIVLRARPRRQGGPVSLADGVRVGHGLNGWLARERSAG